jgi:pyruvate formate lyase activating enzyme
MISQEEEIGGSDFPPEQVVKATKENGCQGVSYTYTEPTIFFEYAYDTAVLAKKEGLFNTFVTNGYMTPDTVKTIAPYLDAATVDFKGGADPQFYKEFSAVPSVEPIFEALKEMKNQGVHIEITNLVVPKVGDSQERIRQLASWIKDNLGKDTPFHLLRFHPDYSLAEIPSTSINALEEAYKISSEVGLNYVYIGNVPGHRYENTYCPNCKELIIKRFGFEIEKWHITSDMHCQRCGQKIAIKGKFNPNGVGYPQALI